mmetsp:Transcript_124629/g.349037  ORF Transcript_124629/g.349037 Transcript_124629/m.349037 type:complete len:279 (-) Transcript_124629:883-1719(-)
MRECTEACVESNSSLPDGFDHAPFSPPPPTAPGLPPAAPPCGAPSDAMPLPPPNANRAANGPGCCCRALRGALGESLASVDSLGSVNGRLWRCVPASTKPFCKPEKPALQSSMLESNLCTASLATPTSPITLLSLSELASNNRRRPSIASFVFSTSCRWWTTSEFVLRTSLCNVTAASLVLPRASFKAPCCFSKASAFAFAFSTSAHALSNPLWSALAKAPARAKASRFSSTAILTAFIDCCRACTSRTLRSCDPWRISWLLWLVAWFCCNVCTTTSC